MPMTCVAYGCNNHFVKGCGKQFFRFPMKDPDRLSKWVLAIRRKNWKPSASSRICSDHFTENDYMLRPGAMVPRLRLDAVPSVFDGFPNHLKERLEKKKTLTKKIDEEIIVIGNKNGTRTAVQTSFESKEPKDTNVSSQNAEINVSRVSTPEAKQETVDKQNKMDTIQSCAVPGCCNTSYEGCKQLFLRFPVNDPELLSKWLKALHCECSTSLRSTSICSNHFTKKDYILYPGETVPQLVPDAVPSLFIKLPKESQAATDSQDTNQVKHGPLEKSSEVTCAVHGCNSVFAKECGKRFFRFPMKNPVRLSKWIKALQYSEWELSASSRICSDHFKGKDYVLRPGMMLPQLRLGAVPSVFKARKSRRKPITTTNLNFVYCRSLEVWGEFQEAEIHRPCDHTYSAVHNEEDPPRLNPDTVKLKKKVRTLQRQIQRQRHTIKKLSERIAQLKNNSAQLHQQ